MITMTLGWGAIAALVAWSVLVFWLGRMSAGGAGRGDLSGPPPSFSAPPQARPRPAPAGLAPDTLAAIRDDLARGNKINAIKRMRDATGMGLAEAKQAVEAMEG